MAGCIAAAVACTGAAHMAERAGPAARMAGCTGPVERTAATSTETSIAMLTETSTAMSIGRDTAIAADTAIGAAQPGLAVPAGTAGQRAAQSRPAPRSASSRRRAPRPGLARRRSRGSAGITLTQANVRGSGTPARRVKLVEASPTGRVEDKRENRSRNGFTAPTAQECKAPAKAPQEQRPPERLPPEER